MLINETNSDEECETKEREMREREIYWRIMEGKEREDIIGREKSWN